MTKLVYMDGFDVIECDATVQRLEEFEGKQVVVLDQTCFYPKGGGQDFDTGTITSNDATFTVDATFFVEGEVKHIGSFTTGAFAADDTVRCAVTIERRTLNTRLHSAGHVIDMAIRSLGYNWTPGKGAHYPHMAFVHYDGDYNAEEKDTIIPAIQTKIDSLIREGSTNTIKFMTPEEMERLGAVVPENLPSDKPARVVLYNDFAVPCGGTHVSDIAQIGAMQITKIKNKRGVIHVSYAID